MLNIDMDGAEHRRVCVGICFFSRDWKIKRLNVRVLNFELKHATRAEIFSSKKSGLLVATPTMKLVGVDPFFARDLRNAQSLIDNTTNDAALV